MEEGFKVFMARYDVDCYDPHEWRNRFVTAAMKAMARQG